MMEQNAIDILKTAILLEKRGKAFYSKVAEQASSPEVRQIFEILAQEEQVHLEFLSEQFRHYQSEKRFKAGPFPTADPAAVKTILSDEITQRLAAASYEAAAIAAALDMEKRAVQVYSAQVERTSQAEEKALYQWLVDWEEEHFQLLFQLDQELKEKIWNDQKFWPF